eukprot:scaffold7281_cov171-Amphora_coffeaeformis.AAC.7
MLRRDMALLFGNVLQFLTAPRLRPNLKCAVYTTIQVPRDKNEKQRCLESMYSLRILMKHLLVEFYSCGRDVHQPAQHVSEVRNLVT